MISEINDPWERMAVSTERRIDSNHNLFWIRNSEGNYGFVIKAEKPFSKLENDFKIRGVTIIKRVVDHLHSELYLVLNSNHDWQIFHTLCLDLVRICDSAINHNKMISAVESRLRKWQLFLMNDSRASLSLKIQMGLFSELLCLKNIVIPNLGYKEGILSWVGPNFDKQDFSTKDLLIEVKSFLSSKGPIIHISSVHQLDTQKEPLYLLAYGLTLTDRGISILDLIDDLSALFANESSHLLELFENKLIAYGYMSGISEGSFSKFSIDNVNSFSVSHDFPKILSLNLRTQIKSVNYTIDLVGCKEFEIDINSIFKS